MSLSQEDRTFLKTYDDSKYAKPSVTADMVIFSAIPHPMPDAVPALGLPKITADSSASAGAPSTLSLSDGSLQVLLIRRGKSPYKDQFALPGGFVNPDESVDQAARRELLEETGVDCLCLEPIRTFSTPGRDPRRWVISCAYLALLDAANLHVKAADDAKDARWFQIFLTDKKDGQWNLDLKDTSTSEPVPIHLTFQETYPENTASLLPSTPHLTLLNPENGLAFDHGEILGYAVKKLQNLLVEN